MVRVVGGESGGVGEAGDAGLDGFGADRMRAAHVERARHQADLARRRYMAVDPANRLGEQTTMQRSEAAASREHLSEQSDRADKFNAKAQAHEMPQPRVNIAARPTGVGSGNRDQPGPHDQGASDV